MILGQFWHHFGSLFASFVDTFSVLIFGCLFGCHFFDLGPKMVPKWSQTSCIVPPRCRPKAAQKRSENASATQPRFFIDFGPIWGPILVIFWWFWLILKLVFAIFLTFKVILGASMASFCQHLAFNRSKSNPASKHKSSYLKWPMVLGCGGDALRLQWQLLASLFAWIFRCFSKMAKVWNKRRV